MSLDAIDRASEAVRTGFRITLADLEARVREVEYIARGHLTIAVIWLDNGFALVGKSAPVDPGNFNADHGEQLAYDDALRQAWPLLAFAHLERSAVPPAARVADLDALTADATEVDPAACPHGIRVHITAGLFGMFRDYPEGRTWMTDAGVLTVDDERGITVAEFSPGAWASVEDMPAPAEAAE